MKELTHDKNGKLCAAKTAYMTTLAIFLVKVIISGMTYGDWSAGVVDYSGMAIFLAPLGAVYFGRSRDKYNAK